MGWTHPRCRKIGGMDGLIVIYDYQDDKTKSIIDEIKFGFNKSLIVEMLRSFRFETGEEFNGIIPVPLHFYRKNWRGFNQAEEIAKVVGEKMTIEVIDAMVRKRRTKQQSLILNREEREINVKGAFGVKQSYLKRMRGKKILLVDDVFTSGADMRECTKILKKAGAKIVWGLALAH